MRVSGWYRLAAIAVLAAIVVSACGGPPATEADKQALIGGWAPTGKYPLGVTHLDSGFVVVHANGDFDFYEKPGYIARRSWNLSSKTTLVLTSGNQISTTCKIELSASTLRIHNGSGSPCADSELDPLSKMATDFFKAIAVTPLD